jgi:uncharacterized membrane protein YqjE
MPADLIALAAFGAVGLVLSVVVVVWDRSRQVDRQHRALRSFYERE